MSSKDEWRDSTPDQMNQVHRDGSVFPSISHIEDRSRGRRSGVILLPRVWSLVSLHYGPSPFGFFDSFTLCNDPHSHSFLYLDIPSISMFSRFSSLFLLLSVDSTSRPSSSFPTSSTIFYTLKSFSDVC